MGKLLNKPKGVWLSGRAGGYLISNQPLKEKTFRWLLLMAGSCLAP